MAITKSSFGYDYGRQIVCDRRPKNSITFTNHLERSPMANWCQLHSNGDKDKKTGFKHYSRIRLVAQDYSNGTGDNSFYCFFNFEPIEIKNLKNIVDQRWAEYCRKFFKITNKTTSEFQQVIITRNPDLNNPWIIEISNGNANVEYYDNGALKKAVPIKDNTKTIKQMFTEDGFWNLITTVSNFINLWEQTVLIPHIKMGIDLTTPIIEADKAEKAKNSEAPYYKQQ